MTNWISWEFAALIFSCCYDDILWLAPFIFFEPSWSLPYIICMEIVGLLACGTAFITEKSLNATLDCEDECYWSPERILGLGASFLLFCFSLYLFWEWYEKRKEKYKNAVVDDIEMLEGFTEGSSIPEEAPFTLMRLITISLMGSLDDIVVQGSLIVGGVFSYIQLFVGVTLGAILVVIICILSSRLEQCVHCLHSIPLFLIIAAFAIFILVDTFIG